MGNKEIKQKKNKSTETLSQIREEVEKYKSMSDVQLVILLEDMWVQMTETSSPKSDIILYLQSELAQTYFRLQKFDRSQNLFHDLWEKQKEVLGESNPATLETEFLLGRTNKRLGRFGDASAVFQDLLKKQYRVLGKDHPVTLGTEFLLGQTYGELGRLNDALVIFQDLLEKQYRVLSEEHSDILEAEFFLGQIYERLGRFSDALAIFQDLLKKQYRVLGKDHLATLGTEFLLGQTYGRLEQFDDALVIFQDLLEKQYRVLGEEYPATLETEFFLGQTYERLGRFGDASAVFQDLLKKQYRVLGKDHLTTLGTEFLLGQTYGELGRLNDALVIFQDLLEKQYRVLSEDHPVTLGTEFLLGQTYGRLEQFDDALAIFQDLLKKQYRVLGEDHPATLNSETFLGQAYASLERFSDALVVFQDLLEKQHRVLGKDHLATLGTELFLGQTYVSLGQFDDALAVFQDLLEKQHRVLGKDHLATLGTELFLGQTYASLGQFDDALAVFQDLLEKQHRVLGKEHTTTLNTQSLFGQTYVSLGQFDNALTVCQDLLEKQHRVLGEDHPATLLTEFLLGQIYASLERFSDALVVSQDTLKKQYHVLGKDHPATLLTEFLLGQIYASLERFSDALVVWQDLLEKQRRVLGKEHISTLETELILGRIYTSLERYSDALAVWQDLLKKQRRVLGKDHPATLDTEFLIGLTYRDLGQFNKALSSIQDVLEKLNRVLGKDHPTTLLAERSIKEISIIKFENKQRSSSDESKYIESINFDIPTPDYEVISRFQQYDFDFNRSKRYSELTGVPLVDSSNSEIPSFPKSSIESNFEDIFLEVKNFLNLEYVQLNIKPIMCIYGNNQAGKSNISRMLYGFQYSSTKIIEELKDWRYKKPVRSLPDKLNSLKSKLAETSLSKAQHVRFTIPEDTYNLLVSRLHFLIEEQMSQVSLYFYTFENNWAELVGKLDNDRPCHIHSSRSSFNCDVKVNKHRNDKPTIEINLEPKNSFKIEIELIYESDERNLIGSSIFEVIYNLSSLKIHFSGKQPILIPLKEINLSENLEHLPILHHVMHFSDISHISNQDPSSLKYEEIPEIINNSERVSKEELDILDNRLVYLIYDTLLIELWKISPFSFFVGDTRFFPAERGGILERMQNNVVRKLLQEEKKVPEGLRQYSRLIDESLFFLEENKKETRSKLPILDQNLLEEIENDLINILYDLELRVSQDDGGASEHVFVKKTQKEDKEKFVLSTLPSSIFSLFALNLHIRLSKIKMALFYEEPETHLHPSSIKKLCDLLVKIYQYIQSGEEHNLAMLFTTHSGFFLNFLFLALERKYGLSKMKEILSVIRLSTDESGGTKSEAIRITEEGYSGSPFDEEELKIYEELTRLYNKYTAD